MVSQVRSVSSMPSADQNEVLIVEDEQTSRRALGLLLSSCGYRPQVFATAEEALLWLNAGRHPRVALIDFNLPGMDGLDLIERLRTLTPTTFAVLITATDENSLTGRLNGRPVSYLRKPLDFDLLLRTLCRQSFHN